MILANASILFPPPPPSSTSENSPQPTFEIVYACFPDDKASWCALPSYSALLLQRHADGSPEVLLRGTKADGSYSKVDGWHQVLKGLFDVTGLEIEKRFRPPAVSAAEADNGRTDVSTEKLEHDKDTSQELPPYSKQATAHRPRRPWLLLEPARFFFPRDLESKKEMLETMGSGRGTGVSMVRISSLGLRRSRTPGSTFLGFLGGRS